MDAEALTSMPETREISKTVGAIRNKMACKMNEIPFVPRSIARVRPPVWRLRWNLRSRLRRCSKVSRATLRTARWPIFAKTAFKSSADSVAPTRAKPSARRRLFGQEGGEGDKSPTAEDDRARYDPGGRARRKVDVESVDDMFEEGWDLHIEQLARPSG